MEFTANVVGKGLTRIEIRGERISSLQVLGSPDPGAAYASPGFVDIQINGFAGVDFSDPDLRPEALIGVLAALWKTGVTTVCPTLITNTFEGFENAFRVLETARRLDAQFAATAPCYHLEGPYLSPGESHGAHNPAWMRSPDWAGFCQLQQAAGGNIAIITLAPELPGAMEFIRRARASGVVVALGHTDAAPEQIHEAVRAGATLSTHLGNGNPQMIDRHRNTLWPQMAIDRLQASLICDGFHLPPDMVRVIFRAKGIERCILITDAVHVAWLPPGRYTLATLPIELLSTGQVVTANRRSMAGSTLSMDRAISNFAQFTGAPLHVALQAATTCPASLLSRSDVCREIAEGQPSNVTLFRLDREVLEIQRVILGGDVVYGPSADYS